MGTKLSESVWVCLGLVERNYSTVLNEFSGSWS